MVDLLQSISILILTVALIILTGTYIIHLFKFH